MRISDSGGAKSAMNYIYGALLLHSAKKEVDEKGLKKVLTATGADVDENRLKALIAALSEINIDEALKTASVAQVSAAAQPVETKEPVKEEKKEEKPAEEEKKDEEALDGLGALFG